MIKPRVLIISPTTAKANNGNGQTAIRWARFLRARYQVTLVSAADHDTSQIAPDCVIVLHARRCAQSIADYAAAYPTIPIILVLTGTDLYRDIQTDPDAQRSLELATRLVVLQEAGLAELPLRYRDKTCIIYQSAPSLNPVKNQHDARIFNVIMVGHLRVEKDPMTFMRAATMVTSPRVRMIHVGDSLDPILNDHALLTQHTTARYRWLGNQPHAATRQRLKRSALMVIASRMEGGANVIIEAVTSGVPVIASDISGNRGMLGADYVGYFPVGDSGALARIIDRATNDRAFYEQLQNQCAARRDLFSPEREKNAVLQLVDNCGQHSTGRVGTLPTRLT